MLQQGNSSNVITDQDHMSEGEGETPEFSMNDDDRIEVYQINKEGVLEDYTNNSNSSKPSLNGNSIESTVELQYPQKVKMSKHKKRRQDDDEVIKIASNALQELSNTIYWY